MKEIKGEELVLKCSRCKADFIVGQKFCAECGLAQKRVPKTVEEIDQMRTFIKNHMMSPSVAVLTSCMVMDMALGWACGTLSDKGFKKLIEGINKSVKGGG